MPDVNLTEQLHKKFAHINAVLSSESFLKMDALNGEVPLWIAPYEIAAESLVQKEISNLTVKLDNAGIKILLIDLFELSCSLV